MYASSGFGEQSKYYDEDLLLDGTYSIISVTMDSSSRDLANTDPTILRKGLLLAKSAAHNGKYIPLSTATGYLNGNSPTQFMSEVVVLGREQHIAYDYILGMSRRRTITPRDRVVPVYFSCNIYTNKIIYNNMTVTPITDEQWSMCQRISLVPIGTKIYDVNEMYVRALRFYRPETLNTDKDFN